MGAWIEIVISDGLTVNWLVAPHDGCVDWNCSFIIFNYLIKSRTPRWVRGLKYRLYFLYDSALLSHPTMGAWIEICFHNRHNYKYYRRTPRWVRGLKYKLLIVLIHYSICRTPRWVRGLKYLNYLNL